jgi:broad specificity phosphatase PhoE
MKIQNIYLIRHGTTNESTKNNNNQLMSYPLNTELNETGKEQARKTGEYLKKRKQINIIISSPLLRCRQTAEIIASEIGYDKKDIIIEDKLSEIKINDKYKELTKEQFQNLKYDDENVKDYLRYVEKSNEIKTPIELNEYLISKSTKDNNIYETTESISIRINEFINNLKNLNLENILVVSHSDTIRWLTKILINNVGYDNFQGKIFNNNSYCAITYFINRENDFFLLAAQSNAHLGEEQNKILLPHIPI